jgi:hypothetical protein
MGDAAGAAAAAGAGAGAGAAGGTAAGAGAAAAPWYGDKIDSVTVGFWQNKGIDPADPVAVATKLTEFYRNSEKFVGAPPEEMIRIPKPNAAEPDIKAYWNRIGVPAEAKDYDLSAVKRADGKPLDPAFADTLRDAMLNGRVPKDRAGEIASRMVKFDEAREAAQLAERTTIVRAQQEVLDKNWGTNKIFNGAIAQRTLEELGKAAGLTPEQTKQGWDAISAGGHIGGAYAMEMLRNIGMKMPSVAGEPGSLINGSPPGSDQIMSVEQAIARIEALKVDKTFYKRMVTDKEVAAKNEWDNLHKIAGAELNRRRGVAA